MDGGGGGGWGRGGWGLSQGNLVLPTRAIIRGDGVLCLSVSMYAMICRFSRLYFTLWPSKFKSLFELKNLPPLFEPGDIRSILPTSFSRSVLQVMEPFSPFGLMAGVFRPWATNAL